MKQANQQSTLNIKIGLLPILYFCALTGSYAEPTSSLKMEIGKIDWILNEQFEDDSWTQRWAVESQGPRVFAENGTLKVRLVSDDQKQAGVTIWLRETLPADAVIALTASTDEQVANNACNLNVFVHATEADGTLLQFGRSGQYSEYHKIPNYLFTLTGGITQGWSRARLNPGFALINEENAIRSDPGRTYSILILIRGNHIQYFLNGKLLHDYSVDHPLPGGHFGLRTWFSQVNFEQVRIGVYPGKMDEI
ncbi:MAG: DUF6250 domain-containing protein [Verrucomicrobiota bacterium JB024]|nr:DUF6250 domain-containing protein [Verrucomicrobiota bacterium JB024]